MTAPPGNLYRYSQLASEFVRALRGKRSAALLSRRLGHRTNVVYRWESGVRFPTAAELLCLAKQTGRDPYRAVVAFDHHLASEVGLKSPGSASVAGMLRSMAVGQRVTNLARNAGLSRFAVSRLLKGQTEPRLPDFLRLIHAATGRLLDWLSAFVSPEDLPSVAKQWAELEGMRTLAYAHPYSEAILAALETRAYRQLPQHRAGWLATTLRLSLAEEEHTLQAMAAAGIVHWRTKRWCVNPGRRVDTGRAPEEFERLKRFWAHEGSARLDQSDSGHMAYSVMSIAERDLDRVAELLLQSYREVRRICANSESSERVVLLTIHLCPLDGGGAPNTSDTPLR